MKFRHRTGLKFTCAILLTVLPFLPNSASADWKDKINQTWHSVIGEEETAQPTQAKTNIRTTSAPDNDHRFLTIWNKVISKLDKGIAIIDEMTIAPESKMFGADKAALREDLDDLLDNIILLLEDQSINHFRRRTIELEEHIEDLQQDIILFREARVTAPAKHTFKTSREEYDEKIAEARESIKISKQAIKDIRQQLHKRISELGLNMDEEQVAVLLSRVDADDIIQMAAIFDIIRQLTDQLMQLTAESDESIDYARRYYGMYLVLLELTVRMQHNYIVAVDEQYLPRIDMIVDKTMSLNQASKTQLQAETDTHRQQVYRKNIKAQELTLKTARLYMDNLRNQRDRVKTAVKEMSKGVALAHNTYDTVQVSAELLELLRRSSNSFDSLMNLQAPEIVPFENKEMLKKYQELSRIIAQ